MLYGNVIEILFSLSLFIRKEENQISVVNVYSKPTMFYDMIMKTSIICFQKQLAQRMLSTRNSSGEYSDGAGCRISLQSQRPPRASVNLASSKVQAIGQRTCHTTSSPCPRRGLELLTVGGASSSS